VLAASTADVVADLRSWLAGEPATGAARYEGMFDLAGLLESLLLMWGMKAVM
jgi:hypothetical protein